MTTTWEQLMAAADQAYQKGDVENARQNWLEAVNAAEQSGDLKKAGMTLDRLAAALCEQKQFNDAVPVFEMASEVKTEVYGSQSVELISTLNGWLDALFAQQNLEDALPVARQLLDSYKTTFGEEHPGTAAIATNLASRFHDSQNPAAEEFYKQALAVKTKTLGYKHPDVTNLTQRYAALLKQLGRTDEAAAMMDSMVSSVSGVWKTVAAKMDKRGEKLTDSPLLKSRDQQ